MKSLLLTALLFASAGDDTSVRAQLQTKLDALRTTSGFPGATLGVALEDGSSFGLATGLSDIEKKRPMQANDLLLAGSVGKTFVAAVAFQLVHEKKLDLDAKVATHLGAEPWFARLPNAHDITVRMSLGHTSGLVRYEFDSRFLADLTREPDRVWKPEELVAYLLDTQAPFAAGKGWDYSDTNYIVLGMIVERVCGAKLYDEIARRILGPLELTRIVPSDRRTLPGLSQGYAGDGNPFGGVDAMLADGRMAINPQFEWAGGGYATCAEDLARWMRAFHTGRACDAGLLAEARIGVDAPLLGSGMKYGLGVIVWSSPIGPAFGHSGYFPGYRTEAYYFAERKVALALQINTSSNARLARAPRTMLAELAAAFAD
ncbi:MAG: serine hydrolase domain-containing protein [Planctomycetota bacterium]